jgi:HEAT repeat protein
MPKAMDARSKVLLLLSAAALCAVGLSYRYLQRSGTRSPKEPQELLAHDPAPAEITTLVAEGHGRTALDPQAGSTNPSIASADTADTVIVVMKGPEFELAAQTLSERWIEAVMQLSDPSRREAALAEIKAALRDTSSPEGYAALLSLAKFAQIDYDKSGFHELVPAFLKAAQPTVRRAALYALYNTGAVPEDLPAVLPLVDDADVMVRGSMAHLLRLYSKSGFTAESQAALSKLLSDTSPNVVDSSLSALGGCSLPTDVLATVLSLGDKEEHKERIFFQVLRTMPDKSAEVVDKLISAGEDSNQEVSSAAISGLRIGVPPELEDSTATRLVGLIQKTSNVSTRRECIQSIGRLGGPIHLNELIRLRDDPMLDKVSKSAAASAIQSMRSRLGM